MGLDKYNEKRDFTKSKEPEGKETTDYEDFFVIQKHDATNLHYDFRLSIDGVLKSWAVPKGLSLDPKDKRLGIHTEDHPIDYGGFEGVIPEGEYGAGTVMLWDTGEFENVRDKSLSESYEEGKIEVKLKGEKIKGAFVLTNLKGSKKNWLIIKMKDDLADAEADPLKSKPDSVKTGRTMKEIEKEESS